MNFKSPVLPIVVLIFGLILEFHFTALPLSRGAAPRRIGIVEGDAPTGRALSAELPGRSPQSVAKISDQVTDISGPLGTHSQLRKKALRSESEQKEYVRLHRSRAVLLDAVAALSDDTAPARDEAIHLLQEALSDGANPDAEYVADQVEQILFADDLTADRPSSICRELAADKGELMLSYLGAYPVRLQQVLQRTKGTSNEDLVKNVLEIGERRHRQSQLIVQELNAIAP